MSDKKTIVIVGVGRGLGLSIAQKFGREGCRVVLMARNRTSLLDYQKQLAEQGIEAVIQEADAVDTASLTNAFQRVQDEYGTVDALIYNVGVTPADEPGTVDATLLMERYQVDVASAWHCIKQVVTEKFTAKKGAILLTGGGLALNPEAIRTPLSLDKAALRSMAQLLHKELGSKGVFVGTVTICGGIGMTEAFAPEHIAETYWDMYQNRDTWEIQYRGMK